MQRPLLKIFILKKIVAHPQKKKQKKKKNNNVEKKKKMQKKKGEGKIQKKGTLPKRAKITIMWFTNGSKLMTFWWVTPLSPICTPPKKSRRTEERKGKKKKNKKKYLEYFLLWSLVINFYNIIFSMWKSLFVINGNLDIVYRCPKSNQWLDYMYIKSPHWQCW